MKIIFTVIVLSISLFAQDDFILKLFPGKWRMDIDKSDFYEEWELLNDNDLVGESYSVTNGEKGITENLYLKKFGSQWAYIAHPINQTITLFALIQHTPKKFIFENKEHDFPQRIIYEFHKDGKLSAVIEGELNGELKRKEFSFTLVED